MSAKNYGLITTEDALKALVEKLLADNKPIGFDIETGYMGADRKKGALFIDWDAQFTAGFSITNSPEWARYVPVAHDYARLEGAWEIIKPVLETLPVIAHNMKFEKRNLRALERKGQGPAIEINTHGDSVLQAYVLSEWPEMGLKDLVRRIFDHRMAEIESLFPDTPKNKLEALRFNVLDVADPAVVSYACEDAAWCLALHDFLDSKIQANPKRAAMYEIEMRTMNQLCDIEDAGHAVDWEAMEEQMQYGEPFEDAMTVAARDSLALMRGGDADYSALNLKSSKQMGQALYVDLGLYTSRKTKSGNLSTDATALERLAKEHVGVKKVLEVREVANLAGRLKKWCTEYTVSHDKRVHASFNQVVVGSGRFSANDPAIQQLPKEWRWTTLLSPDIKVWDDEHWSQIVESEKTVFGKHYWGGNFRDFMVAGEGCYLLFFDYSQIELRALAGMSQEPYLIDAFNRGVDIHRATAAMMLGMDLADVKDKDRSRGKTLNFGIVYGMGPGLLADELGIDKSEAEELLFQYMSAFTEVSGWIARQKAIGKEYGFVETHFGRKVTLWDLQSSNFAIYGKGERLCVNAPVQGTAADIMKIAMLRTEKSLRERGWWMTKVRIINNVHDALTFEVDNSVDPVELRAIIQKAVVWEIPTFPEIVVDWELGQNWGHAAKWKEGDEPYFDGTHWQIKKAPKPEPVPEILVRQADFTVQTSEMPSRDALNRFVALLQSRPGDNVVTLDTPEGEVVLHAYTTSLTPQDQGEISLALGGARAFVPVTVDVERLAEGLTL